MKNPVTKHTTGRAGGRNTGVKAFYCSLLRSLPVSQLLGNYYLFTLAEKVRLVTSRY
jgi:hypothetical protein